MRKIFFILPLLIMVSGCCHLAKSICGGLPESSCKQVLKNWNSNYKDLDLAIKKHHELKKALEKNKEVKEAILKDKELKKIYEEINFDKDDIDSIKTLHNRTVKLLEKGAGLDKKEEKKEETVKPVNKEGDKDASK